MKKPACIALILLISCVPLAGKSNHNECSAENNVQAEHLLDDDVNNTDRPAVAAESLITRFIYTF